MIDGERNPVQWALLVSELDEAREHLECLVKEMASSGAIENAVFETALAHVYSHLNRVWNAREGEDSTSVSNEFPNDLKPVG